jgi:hypothetical protein
MMAEYIDRGEREVAFPSRTGWWSPRTCGNAAPILQ